MRITLTLVVASLALAATLAAPLGENEDADLLSGEVPYVLDGNFADPSHSKHTVGLTLYNRNYYIRYCGAARFNTNWFITAAECLDTKLYDTVQVVVPNDVDPRLHRSVSFISMNALQFTIHPGYNATTKENNIAVFHGRKTYNNPKKFLSLPRRSDQTKSFFPEPVVISSWSRVKEPGRYIEDWQMNVLPTRVEISRECQKRYPTKFVEERHVCVSNPGGKRVTEDAAGTPLVLETRDEPILVGIASHIQTPLDSADAPLVFLKTTPYLEWIHQKTSVELLD